MTNLLLLGGFLFSASVVTAAAPALVTEIVVGTTPLSIPAPVGYVPVTEEMKPYADAIARVGGEKNVYYASFLTEQDAALASQTKMPVHERRVYVLTLKEAVGQSVTQMDFSALKRATKAQYASLVAKYADAMPDMENELPAAQSNADVLTSKSVVSQLFPMEVHYETENAMAFSMLIKGGVYDEHANLVEFERVTTATLVFVQDKVLFLYVSAEKSALQWTRSASRKWAKAVLAANP